MTAYYAGDLCVSSAEATAPIDVPLDDDHDEDDDGVKDLDELGGDVDGDGIPNHHDRDSDGDGLIDGKDCTPWGAASGTRAAIADDICNGKDDDCNGLVDEDFVPTECGLGACRRTSRCIGGKELACRPAAPAVSDERASCDGIDNDCDGAVDEDSARALMVASFVREPPRDWSSRRLPDGRAAHASPTIALPAGVRITLEAEVRGADRPEVWLAATRARPEPLTLNQSEPGRWSAILAAEASVVLWLPDGQPITTITLRSDCGVTCRRERVVLALDQSAAMLTPLRPHAASPWDILRGFIPELMARHPGLELLLLPSASGRAACVLAQSAPATLVRDGAAARAALVRVPAGDVRPIDAGLAALSPRTLERAPKVPVVVVVGARDACSTTLDRKRFELFSLRADYADDAVELRAQLELAIERAYRVDCR